MECPNCSFHNTPGLGACVRCASALDLSGVDVLPPRAARGAAARAVRMGAARVRFRAANAAGRARAALREVLNPSVDLGALLRAAAPGWGHASIGQRVVARVGFGVWCGLVVAAVLCAGGRLGWFFYFAVVGWHGFLISLLLGPALAALPLFRRALAGLLVFVGLNAAIYLPARWALRNAAAPVPVTGVQDTVLVRDGDVVLRTGPWTRPASWRVGELVVYRMHAVAAPGVYVRPGLGLDRIIAGPGDRVVVHLGDLTVNGEPVPPDRAPLAPLPWRFDLDLTLADATYCILPTTLRYGGNGMGQAQMVTPFIGSISVVSEGDILGRVWWRLRPWGRFGPVEPERGRTGRVEP